MSKKSDEGKREKEEVTVKLSGNILERVLEERAKRERETKKPVSIVTVVNEIIKGGAK